MFAHAIFYYFEACLQWKTLEKRRYLKFSSGVHEKNFLVSVTFFTERERVLHGNIFDTRIISSMLQYKKGTATLFPSVQ